jgi:uncharacterized protein YjdB
VDKTPAASISLNTYILELNTTDNTTDTLTATILPEGADAQVWWSTDKPAMLNIVQNGLSATLTARNGGTAKVKVKTLVGGKSVECDVTITKSGTAGALFTIAGTACEPELILGERVRNQ